MKAQVRVRNALGVTSWRNLPSAWPQHLPAAETLPPESAIPEGAPWGSRSAGGAWRAEPLQKAAGTASHMEDPVPVCAQQSSGTISEHGEVKSKTVTAPLLVTSQRLETT